jgi:hypothetical protein
MGKPVPAESREGVESVSETRKVLGVATRGFPHERSTGRLIERGRPCRELRYS